MTNHKPRAKLLHSSFFFTDVNVCCRLDICCHLQSDTGTAVKPVELHPNTTSALNYRTFLLPASSPTSTSHLTDTCSEPNQLFLPTDCLYLPNSLLSINPSLRISLHKCQKVSDRMDVGTFRTGISTVSLIATDPCRIVPVMTVP